jgi:predicted signal transduction protein with EAL and GGDEF domain
MSPRAGQEGFGFSPDLHAMPAALIDLLPDLVFLMSKDGTIVAHMGGKAVPDLRTDGTGAGGTVDTAWSDVTAKLIKRLLRRSIASRMPVEARFSERGQSYDVRITPQGPNRAVGVVRPALAEAPTETPSAIEEPRWLGLDRRGFLRRLNDSLAMAALREQPLAVAVIQVEGVSHIARTLGVRVSEGLMSDAITRASANLEATNDAYIGQLREDTLAAVICTDDTALIEQRMSEICAELKVPVQFGQVDLRLTPYSGIARAGVDASTADALIEHARTASAEARRALSEQLHFYSDSMQLRSLSRLDLGRELRDAIASRGIRFRYVGRHELASGRQVDAVAYLRWQHPLRGEIPPAEFLRIAVATGLSVELSRMALEMLAVDALAHSSFANRTPEARISFGPLRDHIFHDDFVADVERVLARAVLPPERLELRIAERAFVARETPALRTLQQRGVRIVVDEAGRGVTSLVSLATAPIWGFQLDRASVSALREQDDKQISRATALKVCRAVIDDRAQRDELLAMGCRYGTGDFFVD